MPLMTDRSRCRFCTIVTLASMTVWAVAAMASAGQGFSRTLKKNDITFAVSSGSDTSTSTVGVTATASAPGQTSKVSREIDGTVTRAEVADLDGDLAPEVYVWVQSAGSGSYGSLVGYVADKQASLSEIAVPSLQSDARLLEGYMGHDEFRILRTNDLIRRFPLVQAWRLQREADRRPPHAVLRSRAGRDRLGPSRRPRSG